MGDKSNIGWTDATWNPVRGCRRVSPGCGDATGGGCYAERIAARFSGPGQPYDGLARRSPARWTGRIRLLPKLLDLPLRWRKPRMIFVNSMSDLFHSEVPDEFIAAVFSVMAAAPQHTFQVLTKRALRMLQWHQWYDGLKCSPHDSHAQIRTEIGPLPLPNVWLGVSVEDQRQADARIPHLLATPAAVRFVSAEPLLGPLDVYGGDPDPRLGGVIAGRGVSLEPFWERGDDLTGPPRPGLDWLIAGGESGPGARPCELDWLRSLRDQCGASGTFYYLKQLGGHPDKRAGDKAVLDGRLHQEMP